MLDTAVIVLAHNGAEYTERCLESVLAATDLPAELFVVDNASTDETPDVIARCGCRARAAGIAFQTWRNDDNVGCSAARNRAWARARSRTVVFLDNDTAIRTRTWLSRLAAVLAADAGLGLVGPKLLYPYLPHLIQCAGVRFSASGRVCFCGRGCAHDDPQFTVFREVPALISACWMMHNDLRDRVGMLDEHFHPVQYEDLDLCLRARAAGCGAAYTPDVEVYHFEGITTGAQGAAAYQRTIARNSLRFRERWHAVLAEIGDPDLGAAELNWRPRQELPLGPCLDLSMAD